MSSSKIRIYEAWLTPNGNRGSVVVDAPKAEIVIAFDDETALRRATTLSRKEAMQAAEAIANLMAVKGTQLHQAA